MKHRLFGMAAIAAVTALAALTCARANVVTMHGVPYYPVLPAAASVNWPQTFYDAGLTGFNPKEHALSPSTIQNVTPLWGGSVPGGVLAFALDKGTIFAQGQGSGAYVLTALDAVSGSTKWTVTTNGGWYGYPSIAAGQGLVFALCGNPSLEGSPTGICAYRQKSGKQVWSYIPNCSCLPAGGTFGNFVYANGALYLALGPGGVSPPLYIVSLDAKSGQPLWAYNAGPHNVGDYVAVGGSYVYFDCEGANNFEGVCALQQSSGSFVWSYSTGDPNTALTVSKGVVYANYSRGSVEGITALNGSTGALVWNAPFGGSNSYFALPAAVAKGAVYVAGNGGPAFLTSLNATTGAVNWSVSPPCGQFVSSPSVANGVVYVDRSGGNGCSPTDAYAASSGSLLWSSTYNGSTLSAPPIIASGVVYTTHASCGAVCAYGLSSLRRRVLPSRLIRR